MGIIKKLKGAGASKMLLACLTTALLAAPASANPNGPTVTHGQATITGSGQNMTIQQATQQAIINWNGFSINAGEMVRFLQPSQFAAVLNRVTGADPSVINGILQGNGNIFLINPNGVLIGPGGMVNAGGFLASTLNVSDADFLSGNMLFKQATGQDLAAVVNQGQIKVADGGFVVLMAPSIANEGLIIARGGEVQLGAGKEATVNFDGQGLVSFAMAAPSATTDGTLIMTRADANNVLAQAVSDTGIQEAGSLYSSGEIQAQNINLEGGQVNVADSTSRSENLTVTANSGDANLGTHFALDGHSITVTAAGNITFDTLVAEVANGEGGVVSLTADGSNGISMNSGGQGIAANLVELTASQGNISTSAAANVIYAAAPQGSIALSLRPGVIDPAGGDSSSTSTSSTLPQILAVDAVTSTGSGSSSSTSGGSSSTGQHGSGVPIGGTGGPSSARSGGSNLIGGTVGGSGSTGGSGSGSGTGSSTGGAATGGTTGGSGTATGGSSSGDTGNGTTGIATSPVGINGTYVRAQAGGDVTIDSVNTVYVDQISGRNVTVNSQTGSIVDSGDTVGVDNRDIIATQNASLNARDFLGTVDNPMEVEIGGNLAVYAGSEIDGISGVLIGDVFGEYQQNSETAGIVLLNPGNGVQGLGQAQRGVMDNSLPGDTVLGGATVTNLFFLRLLNTVEEEDWLELLRGTVVWQDVDDEATEADL